MTDASGEVTLATRYTPWGDTLESYGTGNLAFGYFGGVIDAATGLLYVGNGQYYDPATGRFLTRDTKPNQDNPYTPFDPMGMLVGPLGLVALIYGRKKKGSKWGMWIALLLVVGSVGMSLSACKIDNPTDQDVEFTATLTPKEIKVTATVGPDTVTAVIPMSTSTPIAPPNYCSIEDGSNSEEGDVESMIQMALDHPENLIIGTNVLNKIALLYNINLAPGDHWTYEPFITRMYGTGEFTLGYTPRKPDEKYYGYDNSMHDAYKTADDSAVYITGNAFKDCSLKMFCIASVMVHEATHSWVEHKIGDEDWDESPEIAANEELFANYVGQTVLPAACVRFQEYNKQILTKCDKNNFDCESPQKTLQSFYGVDLSRIPELISP